MDLKAAADQIFVVSYFASLAKKSLDNFRRKNYESYHYQ